MCISGRRKRECREADELGKWEEEKECREADEVREMLELAKRRER